MRMRRKKYREERYENCSEVAIKNILDLKDLKEVFENNHEIHIEIGCGKGKFVKELSFLNPEINYIAIEKNLDVLILAMEKIKNEGIKNVKFLYGDANILKELDVKGQVQRIYINFCDPWKKSGQVKRRLTHANYLELYERLLKEQGEVHFKTDNRPLFEFSLNSFCDYGLKLKNITLDLHHSSFTGNIMTEYETLFSEQGMPINRCEVIFNKEKV